MHSSHTEFLIDLLNISTAHFFDHWYIHTTSYHYVRQSLNIARLNQDTIFFRNHFGNSSHCCTNNSFTSSHTFHPVRMCPVKASDFLQKTRSVLIAAASDGRSFKTIPSYHPSPKNDKGNCREHSSCPFSTAKNQVFPLLRANAATSPIRLDGNTTVSS